MISQLKELLFGETTDDDSEGKDDLQLAAAALLIEAATVDGQFDAEERAIVTTVLRDRFALTEAATGALIEAAERRVESANQILGFTRVIKDSLPVEDRTRIIEMLWEVAYADGELHEYEAGLVRRVTGLLFVSDRDSGSARQRVLARLDTAGRGHT